MRKRWNLLFDAQLSTTTAPLTVELDPSRVPLKFGQVATNWRLIGRGGTAPYAYSIVSGSLSGTGLTLNTDGTITGTPTTVGTRALIVQIQDSGAQIFQRSFSITIASNLSYTAQTIPSGEVGVPFSFTFRVSGAADAVTWSIVAGSASPGLSLSSGGVLSGTPTTPDGTTAMTIRATDSGGATLDIPVLVTIAPALALVLPSPQTELFNGQTAQFDLTPWFTGGVAPYSAKELGGLTGYGLSVQSAKNGRWYIVGTLRMNDWDEDIPPPGSTAGVTITDALGAHVDVAIGLVLRNPVNSIGSQLNGIDAGPRTATKVNWTGGFVRAVTPAGDQSLTTIDIGMTLPASSVAGRVTGTGDPVAITATVNTVLGFPAFGSLGFGKVAAAMLTSTAAASSARVYGNGDWVTSVTGPWGATSFLVSGTQVVGARQTGFAAATGTAEKGAFATYDAPTAGATYTQAQIQTLMNTVQTLTRQLKALKDACITHGLIGT